MAEVTHKNPILQFVVDVVVNSIIIIVVFFVVQRFIVAPFQVIGSSMLSTLRDREYIVVSKIEYFFSMPERGDVIVFKPPTNDKDFYVKRIVGIPGDTVSLRNGKVYVNSVEIAEPYLDESVVTCVVARMASCPNDNKAYVVPEDTYFVLGDNREGSSDSRAWRDGENEEMPFVNREDIAGKARIILLPTIKLIPQNKINL